MKTAVTATSRAAYHSLPNKHNKVEQFARYVLARTERGQRTWDRIVYRELGMLPGIVSARRNDLEKMGTIELDGKKYRLQDAGRSKDPTTQRNVNTYSLVLAKDSPQLELF